MEKFHVVQNKWDCYIRYLKFHQSKNCETATWTYLLKFFGSLFETLYINKLIILLWIYFSVINNWNKLFLWTVCLSQLDYLCNYSCTCANQVFSTNCHFIGDKKNQFYTETKVDAVLKQMGIINRVYEVFILWKYNCNHLIL